MNDIIKEDLEIIYQSGLDWEKFKNATVLVTGANGMLASYMVFMLAFLSEKIPGLNLKIIALCRNLKKAKKRFGDFLDSPFFYIRCDDITEKLDFEGSIDYIIHAASPASSQFYGIDPVGVIAPNVFGTKNLLELARAKKSKGFLFFSSGEVCGTMDKPLISEEDSGYLNQMDIRSCYGESKRMGENMCQCWHHQYQVPAVAVRPEHTYGPTIDLENDKRVFAEFVSNVVRNKDIVIKSDGSPVRTFCYIADATAGFFNVLLNGKRGESYNVGNENGRISIGELANLLVAMWPEKKLKVIYEKRAAGKDYLENKNKVRPTLSIAKIQKLGYQCRFSVRDGFYRTIKSFI
ncbi:NAD-dependent epimerase/dehydratase family protein [Patescibacteria group bacterium]|nr:MAG: NAD-dependent epimerase/dehydratase family protein [Patescibacteria group bacterium]